MAGIYLHIPYCRQACYYCNFHFSTTLKSRPALLRALAAELQLRQDYLSGTVDTLYLGGGTPSLLNSGELAALLDTARELFALSRQAEITLEANPEDVSAARAREWRALGFNRISLGVQSFHDRVLAAMNRPHSGSQAVRAVETLQAAGFANLNIDLIYGLPQQPGRQWEANLRQALDLQVPHLSCYALTVEPRTAWGHWQRQGRWQPAGEDTCAAEYKVMCNILEQAGYEHYEVSNFARPGHRSWHNLAYWTGAPYLGAGPGAHSYNGRSRQHNLANNALYIKALARGLVPAREEKLSRQDRYHEYLLTGLRTDRGIDLQEIRQRFGTELTTEKERFLSRCTEQGLARWQHGRLVLTDDGLLVADSIIVELMNEEK